MLLLLQDKIKKTASISNYPFSFEEADKQFTKIGIEESATVTGGDLVTDLLNNIFVKDNTLTNDMYNIFVANLTQLAATSMGQNVLTSILNAGEHITLSGNLPDFNALGEYDFNSNKLKLGNYINFSELGDFDVTAHELFHAYEDVSKHRDNTYFKSTAAEVDAQLFARITEVQFDQDHNIVFGEANSHVFYGQEYAKYGTSVQETNFSVVGN